MTDDATMAATAVAAVVPYLVEAGKEGAKALGKEAAAGAVSVLGWLKKRLSPGGRDALAKLEKTPDDADRQAALRVAVRDLLAEDAGLRAELARLLEAVPAAAIDQRLVQVGDHNTGVLVAGTGNRTSVG